MKSREGQRFSEKIQSDLNFSSWNTLILFFLSSANLEYIQTHQSRFGVSIFILWHCMLHFTRFPKLDKQADIHRRFLLYGSTIIFTNLCYIWSFSAAVLYIVHLYAIMYINPSKNMGKHHLTFNVVRQLMRHANWQQQENGDLSTALHKLLRCDRFYRCKYKLNEHRKLLNRPTSAEIHSLRISVSFLSIFCRFGIYFRHTLALWCVCFYTMALYVYI